MYIFEVGGCYFFYFIFGISGFSKIVLLIIDKFPANGVIQSFKCLSKSDRFICLFSCLNSSE